MTAKPEARRLVPCICETKNAGGTFNDESSSSLINKIKPRVPLEEGLKPASEWFMQAVGDEEDASRRVRPRTPLAPTVGHAQ